MLFVSLKHFRSINLIQFITTVVYGCQGRIQVRLETFEQTNVTFEMFDLIFAQ